MEFYTNDGADTDDALTKRLELDNAGNVRCQGAIGLPATSRLYLDGEACSGNTYIHESAADTIQLYAGGGVRMEVDTNTSISMSNTDSGTANTIFGYGAGAVVESGGDNNTIVGHAAGDKITTGTSNTCVGHTALQTLTNVDYGTAIGAASLFSATGTANTAVGSLSGQYVSSGAYNTLIGMQAGYGASGALGTGNNNTALGYHAGYLMQGAAHSNTYVGSAAGNVSTTAVENTCLGYNCDIQDATATNQVVVGNNLTGTKDNAIFIGNDSSHIENDFNSDATWNHSSDVRQKTNIEDDSLGLSFIKDLRPVTYKHRSPSEFPKEWDAYDPDDKEPMGGDKTIHGFIAQEVKEALDKTGVDTFQGWSNGHDGRQRVSFESFVMPLIKAVQELSAKVEALENK